MTHDRSTAPPIGGVALLERATGYTLGSLHLVTPAAMDDALVALQEAVDLACVDLDGSDGAGEVAGGLDPVARLRDRACRLLGSWTGADGSKPISIGGHALPASVLTSAGALELAV